MAETLADLLAKLIGFVLRVVASFFDAAWAVLTAVGVPIAAAAIAALVVTRQIRQLDRHRDEDRRAAGVRSLARMLYREVEFATDPDLWRQRAFLRFKNGEELITAYATLKKSDHDVARWAAQKRNQIMPLVDASVGELASHTVGPMRTAASSVAAHAVEELLLWQRGQRDTAWFSEAVRPPSMHGGGHDPLPAQFSGMSGHL